MGKAFHCAEGLEHQHLPPVPQQHCLVHRILQIGRDFQSGRKVGTTAQLFFLDFWVLSLLVLLSNIDPEKD